MNLNAGLDDLTASVRANDGHKGLPEIADAFGVDLEALTYVCMRRSEMLAGEMADLFSLAGMSACWLDGFFAALALAESYNLTTGE